MITYFSFIHKTFQEHCAAVCLSSVADSENHELFKSYSSQMNINEMEYVLRFCCGTSQKAAEFVLTYIVDVVKNETQNDPIASGILKQICTLPLVLLYEAESKFGVINSLHTILIPAVVTINMYIDDYHDDPAYEAALQYFIDKFDTQTAWTEQVQMAELYHKPKYKSTCSKFENSKEVELLAKMLHLKKLKIVSLDESYRASLEFEYINRLVNSLEDLTLKNYIISTESVLEYEFLNTPSHSARLHFDSLRTDGYTNPEKLSHVLQVLHSTGGSIRELEVYICDMKQVIAHVTPFYSILEGITLDDAGFTQECVDTMCDGIIQTCHKISSQEVTYGEHENTADSIVDQPCVCLPLQKLDLSHNDISHSVNKLCAAFPFLGCLKDLYLKECGLMEKDFQTLGPALSTLPNLQHIDLSWNNISEQHSLNEVIQGINHSKITHLDLHFTKLTRESKQNLSNLQLPLLEEIDLSLNDIDAREAQALSVSLKRMPQLRKLDLRCNSIGSHGAKALFESFQYTPHLEKLYLYGNNIEYLTLGSSCQSLPSLTNLLLIDNAINSDGAIALSSSFQYMPQLIHLDIYNNPIGPEGLEAIFRNLHHVPELYTLVLPPFPRAKWSAKLASVFHVRRSNPHNTLVEACIKSLRQNGLWEDEFYTGSYAWLDTRHIKDIVQVAKLHPACST